MSLLPGRRARCRSVASFSVGTCTDISYMHIIIHREMVVPVGWVPLNNQPYLSTLYHQGIYWVPTSQLEKGSNFQAEGVGLLDSI